MPVDMSGKDTWNAIQLAHATNQLSPLHEQLFLTKPWPVVEFYDLRNDLLEISNM